ncbi:sodium:solute symporter [uncultured Bacteroides sp.]|uniref:sodium:solute symporter n=1 Tax=uncultured Bacteroides sp. TaxID=162156 RepID=UPI002AABD5A2|nr:sodium:solute symporter [uncultured Bacteroides sp.]
MNSYYILLTIVLYFGILLIIARLTGRKGGSNAAFFKGENKSPWYVVSFGMIGASISGVTFVSVPGMVRGIDMTYMQTAFGFFFGYLVVALVLLPIYYKLNLTSIYTYLGTRIGNRAYKTGASFFLLSRMVGAAAKLYLVCLILYTYVFQQWHVPFWSIAAVTVLLIWLYTKKSGIKTIIWTDTVLTFCLLAALVLIITETVQILHLNFGGVISTLQSNEHFRIFEFNDWHSRQNFLKQFFSGIFIVIVMTGLDQDMMQKNLSCRNLKEAQKNMYCYGFSFIPVNFLFLCLGILLLVLAQKMNLTLPALSDDILPMFAAQGYLGPSVLILFSIGIIAASFSSSDSALTSLTTCFCVDILGIEKDSEEVATRKRRRVHFGMSVILVLVICIFQIVNDKSVIDAIYTIASYTYGPLLGLFAFGLFTSLQPKDKFVPYVAVASPLICYATNLLVEKYSGYKFGYEMLMFNGTLTFAGLILISKNNRNKLKQEIWKS